MKRELTFIIILFFHKVSFCQSDTIFKSSLNDSILNKIYSYLPKGWTVTENNSQLIFRKIDSVYILENPYDSIFSTEIKAERRERIIKEGKRGVSRIILRYEDKWNYTKILISKNNNLFYTQKLHNLPEKYKISSLYDKELSTKLNLVYIGTTEKEKNSIKKYEKERSEILSKITILPNYNTENFSIFVVSREGCIDPSHYVVPEDASLQFYKILTLFFEFAGQ